MAFTESLTTLSILFHEKKLYSRLSSSEMQFYSENGYFAFLSPLLWLRNNARCSS